MHVFKIVMKKAVLYKKEKNFLRCLACNHKCVIGEEKFGICGVRKNIGGVLYLLTYGKVSSENIDPIEKKPLYHFLPCTFTYSIGGVGCNFKCPWCQNFEISQIKTENEIFGEEKTPKEIVNSALKNKCPSISYTYNEPTIWAEFVYDISKIAKKNNLKNIWVTNGYFSEECLDLFTKEKLIDAMNIDLKSFSKKTYKDYCGAKLEKVLNSIKKAFENGIHIELTTLIIPKINDSEKKLRKIAKFIFSLDKKGNIPWHISRFFPMYRFYDEKHFITPLETLRKAEKIGKEEGLKYIHLGNV